MYNLKLLFGSMEYFLPYIDDDRITYTYKFHKGYRAQNKALKVLPNIGKLLLNDWQKDIDKTDIFIMFDSHYMREVAKYIKRINPNSKIYFYFWNLIDEHNQHFLNESIIDEFWTFDKEDARKYSIHYNPQFYARNIKIENKPNVVDTFFLGREKDRKEIVSTIDSKLQNRNINSRIYLIPNQSTLFSYDTYLDKISQSKSILDIVNPNQSGLTLRVMESLFFKKKLITNNLFISEYDFYNSQNIFILGKDREEDLHDFINSNYIDVDDSIVTSYDYHNWVKRFTK